ncbi:PREDICTED: E3 ubiquitin-protein ligase RNF170-like, partial [Nestor notabilis]|uniref:E3 ubiquitin-protein ligase RNF170-like n=1 Tax=Nestor notabilis TaxID=176057 RepID=UPI000523CEBB
PHREELLPNVTRNDNFNCGVYNYIWSNLSVSMVRAKMEQAGSSPVTDWLMHHNKGGKKLSMCDFSCPICLQTATLPVETNCGHLFCGSCLITYWKHSPWLAAITCPLCRQKVVLLDNISCEKRHDKPSKQIVHDIRDYNKRFSGQPRPFADYLYDMPLFLTLALRGIFTWGGLVWLFFLRVAVCSFGTIICLSSPFDMKPGPLCRTLGTADDMVVVSLLLICMINICQQIAPNGVNMARSAAQSMLSEA